MYYVPLKKKAFVKLKKKKNGKQNFHWHAREVSNKNVAIVARITKTICHLISFL